MTTSHTATGHRAASEYSPDCVVCRRSARPTATVAATESQLAFLKKLTASRNIDAIASEVALARLEAVQGRFTKAAASRLIDQLKQQPWKDRSGEAPSTTTPKVRWPDIPAGRYAAHTADLSGNHTNLTNFYKVDRPTEGAFAGRTFVKLLASDEEHPVRGEAAREVLEIIAKDVTGYLRLYGQLIGSCGHCGRTLTDDESRAYGVGPKCRSRLGL
jgi:hypothetical protein